jgi:hypothetical protein
MAIHGCYHSVRSDINTIKNTLNLTEEEQQERGLMFVLKEIVQNADDCGADRLGFGLSRGLPQANHSLLQGPAIIAVNNGPFHLSDVEGIGAIGLSTKENDSSAVGKFGQGLKTVFLICEAFFYLPGPPGPKVDPDVEPRYMYNPWYVQQNDNPVVSWDSEDFSKVDEQYIIAERQKMGLADGFTLWIPLRQRELCRRRNNGRPRAIVPKFLEDDREWLDREFQGNLANELAELMPLLKGIRRIDLHDGRRLGSIQFTQGSQQCIKSFSQQGDPLPKLKGHIEFSTERFSTEYYGYQKFLSNTDLLALKERDSWPTITAIDDWDEEISDKQKAEPHCAVVLQTRASAHEKSQLIIRWAVFLPTEKAPSGDLVESIPFTSVDGSSQHIVLTLHGFFFLQSDRRQIYGWSKDNNGITQEWNKILAEQGTLRLLLPTLEDFARERSAKAVKEFTDALHQSSLYKVYKEYICAEGSWVYTVDFKVPAQSRWRVLKSEEVLLAIPQSTFRSLPEIFPNLEEVCGDRIITFKEWPQLTNTSRVSPWEISDIEKLLQGAITRAPEICADGDLIQALDTFLIHTKYNRADRVVEELKQLLRQAFTDPDFQPAQNLSSLLIRKLPQDTLLGIPSAISMQLRQHLIKLETSCLLLPENVIPSFNLGPSISLSESDAYSILSTLQDQVSDSSAAAEFAVTILSRVRSRQSRDWQKICQLEIISVEEVTSDKRTSRREFRSLNWIEEYTSNYKLFKGKNKTRSNLVAALNEAVQGTIYLTSSELSGFSIRTCSRLDIFRILERKPPLQSAPQRQALLQEILKEISLEDFANSRKQAARYLLHGNSQNFDETSIALLRGDAKTANLLWSRVLQNIMEPDERWRFIDHKLLGSLSPDQCNHLNILEVDAAAVEQELRRFLREGYSLSEFKWHYLSWEERQELTYRLPEDLVKRLEIHELVTPAPESLLTILEDYTYLEGDQNNFPLDQNLTELLGISLIRRSSRPEVLAKQEQLAPPIAADELVSLLLDLDNPEDHWFVIMDALSHSPQAVKSLQGIRNTKWLPVQTGEAAYSPNEIIHLPKIQSDVQRISAECSRIYLSSQELLSQLQHHKAFQQHLKNLFPSEEATLNMLGDMLLITDQQHYRVGALTEFINTQENWDHWLSAFCRLPEQVMPAAYLLSQLNADKPKRAKDLFAILAQPLDANRFISILNALAGEHQNRELDAGSRKAILNVYCEYLKISTQHEGWNEILGNIKLQNGKKEWANSRELCYNVADVDPRDVLHDDLAIIISKVLPKVADDSSEFEILEVPSSSGDSLNNSELQETTSVLSNYFEGWPRHTYNAIGTFLRFLGGDQESEIQQRAKLYFPNIGSALESLEFQDEDTDIEQLKEDIKSTRFIIKKHTENEKQVFNLSGEPLMVRLLDENNATSLIVGNWLPSRYQQQEEPVTIVELSLRYITPAREDAQLTFLVKTSLQIIITQVYGYTLINFDNFWQEVQKSTPPHIRQVQNTLLDDAIMSLRSQIRLDQDGLMKQLIRQYFNLRTEMERLKIDREDHPEREQKYNRDIKKIEQGLQKVRQEIRHALVHDKETQEALLAGVRQRIKNASYDEYSIPFELFQNADDACCELHEMGHPNVSRHFSVKLNNDGALRIFHQGRSINQYQYNGQDWSHKGYSDDLIKMLLLNFSDKSEGVTGKFGLGFKSVFLLTAKPRIISDQLGFYVLGGIYPSSSGISDRDFDEAKSNGHVGTLIKLNVREQEAKPVVKRFAEHAPLQGAFSRWLKQIEVRIKSDKQIWSWVEEPVPNVPQVYVGSSSESSSGRSLKALLLGKPERRCFIQLGPEGCVLLPENYPTFWVTTPTRMALKVGFTVNAPFHPDIGRSQLDLNGGGKAHNEALAAELGQEFGQMLVALYQLSEEQLCQSLNLATDTTHLTFWSNLWAVFGKHLANQSSTDKGIELLKSMFWSHKCGLELLYRQCDALPTDLSEQAGAFNCLTRISKIKWSVGGSLSKSADDLLQVLSWPTLKQDQHRISPGEIISPAVARSLRSLIDLSVENLNLLRCLQWQLCGQVSPEVSHVVEKLITPSFVQSLDTPERQSIEEYLHEVRFQAQNGQWYPARELLVTAIASKNSDENLIAKFAPKSALLAEEYEYGSLALFYVCRGDFQIDSEKQGSWILQADPSKYKYCIQYLVKGQRRDAVKHWLKPRTSNNWLDNLRSKRFSTKEDFGVASFLFDALLYDLGLIKDSAPSDEPAPVQEDGEDGEEQDSPVKHSIPDKALERIFQWWTEQRDGLIPLYEDSVYPDSELKLTAANANSANDPQRWLVLFMLGALHTMGRTKPEQHREFIRHCQEWGWLDVMASGTVNESEWLKLLHDYFAKPQVGDRLKYFQWVRYYPAFYALSNWWQVYRDNFLAANEQMPSVSSLFNPQSNKSFQGSGFGQDAPPLKSILGIGTTFVIRELMRSGILTQAGLRAYSYVPVRRVRALLCSIGCEEVRVGKDEEALELSSYIHYFLVSHLDKDKATFLNDFDLPFLMLHDSDEKRQLLEGFRVPHEPDDDSGDISNWIPSSSTPGDFVTLANGRVIPRSYMR